VALIAFLYAAVRRTISRIPDTPEFRLEFPISTLPVSTYTDHVRVGHNIKMTLMIRDYSGRCDEKFSTDLSGLSLRVLV
jgi:hypothetical protein